MTPDQLPPLPEPETLGSSRFGSLYKGHTDAAMTAYGLQCAEAAVERERARCHHIVASMVKVVKETERPESLQSYRDYTANLLEFLADQLIPPSGK